MKTYRVVDRATSKTYVFLKRADADAFVASYPKKKGMPARLAIMISDRPEMIRSPKSPMGRFS